jgi:hypothetical protein
MLRSHSPGGVFVLFIAAAVLTGCGAGPQRTAAPADPYSPNVSQSTANPVPPRDSRPPTDPAVRPTLNRPTVTAPPNGPTDALKKTDIVVGTVTRGGSGPCYGVQTDDGKLYSLYSSRGDNLVRGTRVKVRTKPSRLRIDCGAGRFVEMTAFELMR